MTRTPVLVLGILAIAIAAVAAMSIIDYRSGSVSAAGTVSITSPDTDGNVGHSTSLALDAAGYPVVSYRRFDTGELKLLHCNDPDCAGGDESITAPDSGLAPSSRTALALDSAGHPVVSYVGSGGITVLHCNDPNCSGGDESISALPGTGSVGALSLKMPLDAAGNPVIAYDHRSNNDQIVVHCNDPDCAGGDESIVAVDSEGDVGSLSSIVLDAVGNPVVSYGAWGTNNLKVLRCGNPNCTAGNTITAPDALGQFTSVALDPAGNPVVAYFDTDNQRLKVLHCNDPACLGGDESIVVADSSPGAGRYVYMVLDGAGRPVVSYCSESQVTLCDLRILRCGNPNCTAGNTIASPDVGYFSALQLDAAGNPVVSYYHWDNVNNDLRIMHCNNPGCTAKPTPTPTTTPCPDGKVPVSGGCGTPTPTPDLTDTDGDGCPDARENGPDETQGGQRNYKDPNDYYDVLGPGGSLTHDGVIDLPNDILGVIQHFAPSGAPPYDVRFDRGPSSGPNAWNMTAPDGAIDLPNDILGVILQFNHNCT